MKRWHRLLLVLALGLIGLSWSGIATARSGLVVRSLQQDNVPLLYLAPQQAKQVPGVLIAHGFAGSKQLMLGYGYTLAHAGYGVMLWDFNGHGANPQPLRHDLQQNLAVALSALQAQPEVAIAPSPSPSGGLALLGHSMGSGAVMTAGLQNQALAAATIAISPTGAEVTPQAPRNLQLQVGSGEGRFIANAQRLLAAAGGPNPNLAAGLGRELITIPNVEHITILFSAASHQAAVRWLNATFNRPPTLTYVDRRFTWYSVHLLGWLVVLGAIAPQLRASEPAVIPIPRWRQWLGLAVAPVAALGGLLGLSSIGVEVQSLGGVQVGGAIGIWFLIAGLSWLGIGGTVPRLALRSVGLGLGLFGVLWLAFGAMAQVVWLQWWLIPQRLQLWLPLALACLPWFLVSGLVQQQANIGSRLLWWFGQSAILVGGFLLVLQVLPELGFMMLLLPLLPVMMGLFSVVAVLLRTIWAYAIGAALFFGWILAAVFPLAA